MFYDNSIETEKQFTTIALFQQWRVQHDHLDTCNTKLFSVSIRSTANCRNFLPLQFDCIRWMEKSREKLFFFFMPLHYRRRLCVWVLFLFSLATPRAPEWKMKFSAAADIALQHFFFVFFDKVEILCFSCGEHTESDKETLRCNWRSLTETFGA